MNQRRLRTEQALYILAFLLALTMRLVGADQLPVSNSEATLALQALALAKGQAVLLGPHPAYLALTTLVMYLFSAGNWVARFWPAAAGSLLVLVPILFRGRIGRLPALLLAFFLAFDPGMLAASRLVGDLPLALLFTLLALGLWLKNRWVWAGVAAGMAVLSGPGVWPGVLGLALTIWFFRWTRNQTQKPATGSDGHVDAEVAQNARQYEVEEPTPGLLPWQFGVIAALVTIFVAGTLFFFIPIGLGTTASGVTDYLRGWGQPGGVTAGMLLIALCVYEFFPLIFGIWGAVVGLRRKDIADRFLLIWWAVALVLALAYPSRSIPDLVWPLIPLWGLAVRQIARLLRVPRYDRLPAVGQMLLASVILTYISLTTVALINNPNVGQSEYVMRLVSALVMLFASAALIGWGWSAPVSGRGLAWAAALVLGAYFLSAAWDAGGLSSRSNLEFWANGQPLRQGDLLIELIGNLTEWGPQETGGPDVVVVGIPSPALRWLLRNVERVTYVDQLPSKTSPAMVITPNQPELALASSYRGEGFILTENVGWNLLRPSEWFYWLVFRSTPKETILQDRVILWARTDIFPGGKPIPGALPAESPPQDQVNPQ